MHTIYIQQKGQHFEIAVQVGEFKGLTITVLTTVPYNHTASVIGSLISLTGSQDVAYDPWLSHHLVGLLPGQLSAVTPRNDRTSE